MSWQMYWLILLQVFNNILHITLLDLQEGIHVPWKTFNFNFTAKIE